MFLSHERVSACVTEGRIKLSPLEEKYFKEGSYSFTLGQRVLCLKGEGEITVGQSAEYEETAMSSDGYVLQPGAFAIFYTKERITLASDIVCVLSTRGSVAKLGIDMLQSSLIVEPGSDNVLALETFNHGTRPVRMMMGVPVVKGVFFQL